MMRFAPFALCLTVTSALFASNVTAEPSAANRAADVRLAPSAKGVLGAWLALGPFKAAQPALDAVPIGLKSEATLAPSLNATAGGPRDLGDGKTKPPARWNLVSSGAPASGPAQDPGASGSRTVDLKASLEDAAGRDLIAYVAGRLHVDAPGRYLLLLGVDDGVRVSVDGAVVFSRDDARPVRDDDDVIPLDLAAGDHDVVLKLHQRDGAWAFRAKFVDATLSPPAGAYMLLPGTTAADADALAARMSWLVIDRTFDALATPPRYRPTLTVRYPEGVPRGVTIPVTTKLRGVPDADVFDLALGTIPAPERGAKDFAVSLPSIAPWTGTANLETSVAGRVVVSNFAARPASERALVRMEKVLTRVKGDESWLLPGSLDSVSHLVRRLARFIERGDGDAEAQLEEARELEELAANIERGVDPYDGRSGMMRRALKTPFDGGTSELGLYVPPSYKKGDTRKYPLVVGLHGMNSYPMSMMRALFGLDEEKKEPGWKDRHPLPLPAIDAFVITPYAHGNTMYREIGEDDVLYMMDWVSKVFPIDESRITVTGPSMGGIGSAGLPFHYPHVFAAAAPLCGYHSYVIRPDIMARPKRPWERHLLEERSNVYWAENGERLPLYIVHGTRDLPEANSGVLIERYEKLGYSVKHEHPDAGHNVWGPTYGDLKGLKWLLAAPKLDDQPRHVRFRTMRTRYSKSAWITIDELANESSWGDIDAKVASKSSITLTARGVAALTLDPSAKLIDRHAPVTVVVDGVSVRFDADEPLSIHRSEGGRWEKGVASHTGIVKRGHVSGPIRDVFHEPLLFVYAAGEDARVNERVARGFADRPGIPTSYPVISDDEFLATKEPLANDRALFLVGRTNKVFAALDAAAESGPLPFPLHVDAGTVSLGGRGHRGPASEAPDDEERFSGREAGGAFIYPNPVRPDRYVVFVAGATLTGTLRALSLPDLLPDFVVWDEALAPARGQLLLGAASVRAGGFFKNDWSLPPVTADPLAKTKRAAPQNERDATPSLP